MARPADDEKLRRRATGELQEAEIPAIPLHCYVEARPQLLDLPQLLEQCRELAGRVVPLDAIRLAQNASALLFGEVASEVAEQPRTDALRLADVHDFTRVRQHPINARPVLGA